MSFAMVPQCRTHSFRRLLTIAVLLALSACGTPPPPAPTPTVSVAAALESEVQDWDEFTGRFQAVQHVDIKARVTGYIDRVAFREGSLVNKGDLLFSIDPRAYANETRRNEAELARQHAAAMLARDQLRRAQLLRATGAISRDDFDQRADSSLQALASLAAADAALANAKLNQSFTNVRAPISGRVGRAEVTVGNLVQTGQSATLLTTLVSVDPIYVDFEGDERAYLKYRQRSLAAADASAATSVPEESVDDAIAQTVLLGLADEEGFPHSGRVVFVDNALNPQTGTIRIRAQLNNPDGRFAPGLFARLRLVGGRKHRAVLINDKAVGTDQDQKFVMVLGADNKLAYRPVTLGKLVDGMRVVQSGLQVGERIVVNGLQRVRPGVTVKPEAVPMRDVVAASQ